MFPIFLPRCVGEGPRRKTHKLKLHTTNREVGNYVQIDFFSGNSSGHGLIIFKKLKITVKYFGY
jgi:hypothetical protein